MTQIRFETLDGRWLEGVQRLVDDAEAVRFTRIPEHPPEGFASNWIRRYETGSEDGTKQGFAAVDADGRFVGLALAPEINRETEQLELGYMVLAEARGRGVGSQILALLTEWAFREARAKRATLIIDVENVASQRVAERCGYTLEGVMRSTYLKAGRRIDAGLWSRLPTDP